ncbi:copper-translocating P-type ATPase [Vibrio variabilis]|uniref:Copper-translocating P-type ATPase n=1 Tax=Vibrio variabilis TaxID=990271 RepID=A0ABQ0JAI1_9VIBR|nr:copper-translocating P-type ATPase [Vibrio variabilis]
MNNPWFNISTAGVINNLQTTKSSGLCSAEAASRLEHYGENALKEAPMKPMWILYLEQYKNPLVFILAIGAIVSAMTGHMVDAIAIAVIILINTGISFWQERKAQKGMEALKEMAAPQAEVLRDSAWMMIPAKELVPGDIIKINTGDILPADVRILEAHQLAVDEAALTGESEPVTKSVDTIIEKRRGAGRPEKHGLYDHYGNHRYRSWCSDCNWDANRSGSYRRNDESDASYQITNASSYGQPGASAVDRWSWYRSTRLWCWFLSRYAAVGYSEYRYLTISSSDSRGSSHSSDDCSDHGLYAHGTKQRAG